MIVYIIDNNGFYLGVNTPKAVEEQNLLFVTIAPSIELIKAKWENDAWIEGATPEEIAEAQRLLVPQIITRRQFKIALAILGKNEQDILNGINQLPEPTKTIALISYTEAGTFERSNPELIFVGKTFLQMTDEQIDNVFTIGSQY